MSQSPVMQVGKVLVAIGAVLMLSISTSTAALAASDDKASQTVYQERTVTTTEVSLSSCGAQVEAQLSDSVSDSAAVVADFCEGTQTITEQRFTVGASDAAVIAKDLGMNAKESQAFVTQAAAGAVQGAKWTHWYNAVLVKTGHSGTTYWDGTKAWVNTYRGLTGKHDCRIEGGYQFGGEVIKTGCNKPGASTKADARYTFDLHAVAKGFPIALNVGLHYAITNKGVRSSWQVGG